MTILDEVNALIDQYATRDPAELADCLGVNVWRRDFQDLLGMYRVILGERYIFINRNIDHYLYNMVLAHELGHDVLHRKEGEDSTLLTLGVFDRTTIYEREADAFAAHLLIDTDEMLELFQEDYDIYATARTLGVAPDLLLIKMQEMNKMGYNFNIPFEPNPCFWKNIRAHE